MWTTRSARFATAALFLSVSSIGCSAAPSTTTGEEGARHGSALDGKHTTLWIHGRLGSSSTREGDYDDFSYWGSADRGAGVDKRAVNWDGRSSIGASNQAIRRALDCFCTGESFCYIAAHSAGDPQIGYALDLYGTSQREVTDGEPDSSGTCHGTGATQVGWNILWVEIAGGAAGGSELANLGYWAVSDQLTSDLRTSTVRSLYDHNDTQGVAFYMVAGAKGTMYSGILPGQDDEVVAYHSAGALSSTGAFCNPGDWFCDGVLETGDAASRRGSHDVEKWAGHSVWFRDDGEDYDHYTRGSWSGVAGLAAADLDEYAR